MIAGLKPYPEYKESDHEWLGMIPTHWNQLRAKYLFREVNERSKTGREELLSVSHLTGVTPRSQKTVTMFLAKSNIGYKICRPGDVVINTMWAWMGALGVARHTGIVSPSYGVYRPIADRGFMPHYANHLLRTPAYAGEYQRRSTGVNSSRLRLYPEQFLRIPVIVPPLEEQSEILQFLDWTNGRMERAILAKRKVIALINEQKQAIIHSAVTRGFDPTVPLKPSGIPCLGDIPTHWEVKPLKQWVSINELTLSEKTDRGYEFRYVDIGSVKSGRLVKEIKRLRFANAPSRARRILRKGDTIVSTVRTYLKAVWHVSDDAFDIIASTGFAVLTPGENVHPKLLGYVLQSANFVDRVSANSIGIAYPVIPEKAFGRLKIALPPTLDEQHTLVTRIEIESAPLDTAIARAEREIALLLEYCTRLIADVVTGKLNVREAAKNLPAEDEEPLMNIEPEEQIEEETAGGEYSQPHNVA